MTPGATEDSVLLRDAKSLFLCSASTGLTEIAPVCADLFAGDNESVRFRFTSAIRELLGAKDREADSIVVLSLAQGLVDAQLINRKSSTWAEGSGLLNPGGPWMRGGFWLPGKYRLIVPEPQQDESSPAFDKLLTHLRTIGRKGPIRAIGRGAPTVGLTLRAELELLSRQYSSRMPEVSATRLGRFAGGKRSLFSRVPTWASGDRTTFLNSHGSFNAAGRWTLNKSIYAHRVGVGGWQLRVVRTVDRIELNRGGNTLATWPFAELRDAFRKFHERVFVYAEALGNEHEKFTYATAVHGTGGSFDRYLRVLEDGGGCFDLTLSRLPSGAARDHGFLFRIEEAQLTRIFEKLVAYDLRSEE